MSATSTTIGLEDGDIAIENGRFKIVSAKDSYLVIVHTAIHTLLGECILDPDLGIDYFDTIFDITKENGIGAWESRIKKLVLSFEFVTAISKCKVSIVDNDLRKAYLELVVETDDGTIEDAFDVSSTQVPIVDMAGIKPLTRQVLEIGTFDDSFKAAKTVAETMGAKDEDETSPAIGTPNEEYNNLEGSKFSVSDVEGYSDTVVAAGTALGVGVDKSRMDGVKQGLKTIIEALGGTV